jgi:two-component system, cell cycle response regulator
MKVLIADDEAVSRKLLENTLRRWDYVVVTAKDGLEALRILQEPDAPKLAILDWLMPGLDGVQICRRIRSQRTEPYTYILLLTGKNAKCDVIEGLDAGADDYVIKPFDSQELQVRLRTGKRILYLQDQLIAAREALRDQATHDSLTGLWNRAATLELLANELARQQRHGGSIGVVLIDLDGFKQINDTYGHLVGDQILHAASQAMQSATRRYDSVGRFGGEEFILILPGCDLINARSHAERVRSAIEQVSINTPQGWVGVTASFGVTLARPGQTVDAFTLLRAADAALYQAKHTGRNCVEFVESDKFMAVGCGG